MSGEQDPQGGSGPTARWGKRQLLSGIQRGRTTWTRLSALKQDRRPQRSRCCQRVSRPLLRSTGMRVWWPCLEGLSPAQLLTLLLQDESAEVSKSSRSPVTSPLVLVGTAERETPHQLPQDWEMLLSAMARVVAGSFKAALGLGGTGSAGTRAEGHRSGLKAQTHGPSRDGARVSQSFGGPCWPWLPKQPCSTREWGGLPHLLDPRPVPRAGLPCAGLAAQSAPERAGTAAGNPKRQGQDLSLRAGSC